ncbi:MAG TPA: heme exporter protein CcmD [Hyphomicrobiaceae bacterium]|jgi:heme exporter protein D|nr:heme exporter protein CcmD [Hyphomicrobiaceae bacterium]
MELGPHAVYIWLAYGVVAVTLAALIGWLVADGRRQRRLIEDIEARGSGGPRGRR